MFHCFCAYLSLDMASITQLNSALQVIAVFPLSADRSEGPALLQPFFTMLQLIL